MLLQTYKQVVKRLLSSRYQDMFTLFVPSCCDKSGTSCYHFITKLCYAYELAVINLLSYVHTISDLLEQLVATLLVTSTIDINLVKR
jgi:hypothetical protein